MSNVPELVLALLDTGRGTTDVELEQLAAHVARAPFSARRLKITRWLRQELLARGVQPTTEKLPSVEIHLLKRIYLDQQWPVNTTVAQFMADLYQAVQNSASQIWTYRWLGEAFAGFLAPSHVQQNVRNLEKFIFVAYSAGYDTIKTGFQASSSEAVFTTGFDQLTRHR